MLNIASNFWICGEFMKLMVVWCGSMVFYVVVGWVFLFNCILASDCLAYWCFIVSLSVYVPIFYSVAIIFFFFILLQFFQPRWAWGICYRDGGWVGERAWVGELLKEGLNDELKLMAKMRREDNWYCVRDMEVVVNGLVLMILYFVRIFFNLFFIFIFYFFISGLIWWMFMDMVKMRKKRKEEDE